MVDNELLAWMHEYKRCSAHYDHWFASKQMQIHCSLLEVARGAGHQATLSRQHRLEKQRRWDRADPGFVGNTSIILRSLLGKLLSVDGTVPESEDLA